MSLFVHFPTSEQCYCCCTRNLTLPLLLICLAVPSFGDPPAATVDLTEAFRAGGIVIDSLLVYKISDIVLLRGRTSDPAMAARAVRLAKALGHVRVANLIEVVPGIDDAEIVRAAKRKLDMARPLEGCTFQLQSRKGVVRVRAQVRRDVQKDYAVKLLRKIDGVVAVHLD